MRLIRIHLIVPVILMLALALPLAALAASPKEAVEVDVQKVLTTLAEPAFKDQSREVKITKIRSIINEIFDYTELSKRTLGREWAKFNAAQQAEFVKLFSDLLEKTYADRLLAYSNEKVVFDKENMLNEVPGRSLQQRPDRRRQENPSGLPAGAEGRQVEGL